MSYYTQHFVQQQNPQQKSLRLLFVVALHAAVIFAVATAVTIHKKPNDPAIIELQPIDESSPPPKTIAPPEIEHKNFQPMEVIKTPLVDFTELKDQPTGEIQTGGNEGMSVSSLTRATIKRAPKPEYPLAASRLGEEGTTAMKLVISAEGRVANAQVIQSSGSARLDEAAIKHVLRNWLFSPCTENGKAVACEQNMRLKWQLEDARR